MAKEQEIPQDTEDKIVGMLTNDPSAPVKLSEYDVFLVFKRPPFKEKYRGRAWSTKKLREFGYDDASREDPETAYFFRSWGIVNTYVHKLYYKDENGDKTIKGEAYSEYPFDPEKDLDYSYVFEKYAIEELFEKGKPEDLFVAAGIIAYSRWMEHFSVDGDDIKNS